MGSAAAVEIKISFLSSTCFSYIPPKLLLYLQMKDHDRYHLRKSTQMVIQGLRLPPSSAPLTGTLLWIHADLNFPTEGMDDRFSQSTPTMI